MSKHLNFQVIPLADVPASLSIVGASSHPVVLVVDDERLIADTLVAILCKRNFAAHAAYDGAEALSIAQLIPPDFLITDIMMPGMNGIELAITVKEMTPDCRVLLFSGHAQLRALVDDPRCASYDFPLLAKPIHPDILLDCISSMSPVSPAA
jgi:DNA-binding NtrC family response regulator